MVSINPQQVVSAEEDIRESAGVSTKLWGSKEDLDWLLNTTETDKDQQHCPDHQENAVNVDQQTITPQTWILETNFHDLLFTNSSSNRPVHQLSPSQAVGTPLSPISSTYFRPNITTTQHRAQITLVPNPSGGFRTIVKRKRKRTMFTTEQIAYLESVFRRKQYVTREERQVLVDQLKVSDSAVKVWFQNRRIRSKREVEQAYYEANSPSEDLIDSSLEQMETSLFQKVDQFGFVTLDETEMEVIVTAIDSVLAGDVSLDLESKDSDQSTTESESPSSIYEPISPAASDFMDEEVSRWQTVAPEQSLQKLFDLHFC